MEVAAVPVYSTGLSGKGSQLQETLTILREIDRGHGLAAIRTMVLEQNLLDKMTHNTRKAVWKSIHARYLSNEDRARILARMVVHSPDRQTAKLVLFYEFCRSTPVLRDVAIECLYPRYAAGFTWMDKAVIQEHFDKILDAHPELVEWAPQTRDKVASNILTILRDFGLLQGTQRKQFARPYVPLPAFVYVLYRLAGDSVIAPHQVLKARDWKLFYLEPADLIVLLDEATTAGHCTFKHQGEVYTLALRYPSLEACVEALVAKV